MNLLLTLLIFAVVFGLIFWLLQMLPLPDPWKTVVFVLSILIAIVFLLSLVFGGFPMPRLIR